MKKIHERIKDVRAALKLSQKEFSGRIYISQSLYGEIELGHREVKERVIQLICSQFNVNKTWLKTGKGEMFTSPPPDQRRERLLEIFDELDELLQDYLLEQSKSLLKIQKIKKSSALTANNQV